MSRKTMYRLDYAEADGKLSIKVIFERNLPATELVMLREAAVAYVNKQQGSKVLEGRGNSHNSFGVVIVSDYHRHPQPRATVERWMATALEARGYKLQHTTWSRR